MNSRVLSAEVAALAAIVIWVYSGAALLVAAAGDGATLSFWSIGATVVLAYGLSRLLGALDISERALRLWGAGLSIVALLVILRLEIAGAARVWEVDWLADLFLHPNRTLEDQGAAIMTVVLLCGTWAWCVIRGTASLTIERVMTESGAGLVVVMVAAALAGAADAPEALRWLPAPFMAASLMALALLHARSVERRARSSISPSLMSTAGAIAAIALLATGASIVPIPSLEAAGDTLVAFARAVGIALAWTFSPLFFAIGWLFDHVPWPFDAPEQPEQPPAPQQEEPPKEPERAQWSVVLGYVARTALVVMVIALVVALLWFAFRRFTRRGDGADDDVREDIAPEGGSLLDGLKSILPRLQRRGRGARDRDAIGRLYLSMLRAASERGLARPASATPLEFSPQLEARFKSSVPLEISRAYAEARYAARAPDAADVERLRGQWKDVVTRS